ncbi:LysR family transcriptional regulator [Shinella zoogloeoides]|uniref:LysR family transcriptional regulator n=1 Tax=Shinella zoogloeoides TaxID=352475 RepID=A0A6N8TB52_SHIZO|nr:LysR family transcriptional regulator [Shinella zoogloeoides]MXO00523.1 LysR family transcriptional regulator [Shinella zoogloeoides]UEX83558.1 LysR family transcriptional regulator [Shinella zoogloeoides]
MALRMHLDRTKTFRTPSPRERALSPALLARIFHQPAMIYFQTVAELLSVRECARRLNVASSAVSRQITQLEDALGMALFQREGRRLQLTPAGEILFRHVRRVASPLEAAVSELDMLRGLKTGSVRIATVESVGMSFLPPLLTAFSQQHPTLHLSVEVTSSADVVARLIGETVDVGFGFVTTPPREIEMAVRRDMRVGVLMRRDHPLAERKSLSLADCFTHPVAIGTRDLSIRRAIQPILDASPSVPPPLLEVGSIRMLVELAEAGHHVSIMTPIGAHNEISRGSLLFRSLDEPGLSTNRFGLMVRAGADLHFAPAVFYEHAKEHFRGLELPGAVLT